MNLVTRAFCDGRELLDWRRVSAPSGPNIYRTVDELQNEIIQSHPAATRIANGVEFDATSKPPWLACNRLHYTMTLE